MTLTVLDEEIKVFGVGHRKNWSQFFNFSSTNLCWRFFTLYTNNNNHTLKKRARNEYWRALANCQNSLHLNFFPRHFQKTNVGNVIGLFLWAFKRQSDYAIIFSEGKHGKLLNKSRTIFSMRMHTITYSLFRSVLGIHCSITPDNTDHL